MRAEMTVHYGNEVYQIRSAYREEWEDAMELAWKTFLKYEAPDYSQQGIRSFNDFITDNTLFKMFVIGSYQMFGAYHEGKMVGMITARNNSHISLLFIDAAYHRRGIGKALISYLCEYLLSEVGIYRVTVNASPYGVEFYHKVGFHDTGAETVNDGIRYTPMEFVL